VDSRIMCCSIISSCQSAATSKMAKRASGYKSDSCKQCSNKYRILPSPLYRQYTTDWSFYQKKPTRTSPVL